VVSRTETVASLPQRTGRGRLYKDGTRKGILVLPGFNNDRHYWFLLDQVTRELRYLTEDYGFPVASCGTAALWGNSTHRANISQMRTNAQTALFASGKVHLWGASAGGLAACNWAKANPTLVQSIVLLVPAVDVQALHAEDRGGTAASIEAAYGGAPPDADNPADYAADLDGIPIRVYYSTDDPYTTEAESLAFIEDSGAEGISMGALDHSWGPPWSGLEAGQFFTDND